MIRQLAHHIHSILTLIPKRLFCIDLTPRRNAIHPYYLSPNYQQLQYSPYYFNQSKKLKMTNINSRQINQQVLPKFLIEQIENDRINFIKTKQVIFLGRSNSGKSSIINNIFNNKKIARVSRNPGTTQFLHFHQASFGADKFIITDAPGYGFANINRAKRQLWAGLIDQYLKISSRLCLILVCINFQHGLKPADIQTLQQISKYNVNIQILLTKADKIAQKLYLPQLKSINQSIRRLQLRNINQRIIACSSKDKFGIDIIKCRVFQAMQKSKTRNIDKHQHLLLEYLKQLRIQKKDREIQHKNQTRPHVVRKLIYNSKLTKFLF